MTVRDQEPAQLMRYLAGELDEPARRQLEQRLESETRLRDALGRLETTWAALSPPSPESEAPDQTLAIMAKIRRESAQVGGELAWSAAPMWVKTGSLASLAAGLLIGVFIAPEHATSLDPGRSGIVEPPWGFEAERLSADDLFQTAEPTSADLYWRALEASSGRLDEEQEDGS